MLSARKLFALVVAFLCFHVPAVFAQAAPTGPDFTPLTDQVSFGTIGAAILLIGGGLMGVYILIKGVKVIGGLLNRG